MTAHTEQAFRDLGARLRNWGRWGSDDERGTTNLITPELIARAGSLIRRGAVFDLGIPVDANGPQLGTVRHNPIHLMSETGEGQTRFAGPLRYADDYIVMPLQCGTQWDALSHVMYDGLIYNGFASSTITTAGAERNAIDKQGRGITGRGVLLDIARLLDVRWLEPGFAIEASHLDAALARQRVEVGRGDIVLLRTGFWRMFDETRDRVAFAGAEPGLALSCCEWLHERDVAVVCADNRAVEVVPSEIPDVSLPLHLILIRDMGMTLGEIFDLEELAADCEADGTSELFFCGPPLKVTGGVGSPVNPLAIK